MLLISSLSPFKASRFEPKRDKNKERERANEIESEWATPNTARASWSDLTLSTKLSHNCVLLSGSSTVQPSSSTTKVDGNKGDCLYTQVAEVGLLELAEGYWYWGPPWTIACHHCAYQHSKRCP